MCVLLYTSSLRSAFTYTSLIGIRKALVGFSLLKYSAVWLNAGSTHQRMGHAKPILTDPFTLDNLNEPAIRQIL